MDLILCTGADQRVPESLLDSPVSVGAREVVPLQLQHFRNVVRGGGVAIRLALEVGPGGHGFLQSIMVQPAAGQHIPGSTQQKKLISFITDK